MIEIRILVVNHISAVTFRRKLAVFEEYAPAEIFRRKFIGIFLFLTVCGVRFDSLPSMRLFGRFRLLYVGYYFVIFVYRIKIIGL